MTDNLAEIVESIVFVSGRAVPAGDIAEKLGVDKKDILAAAETLKAKYGADSGIQLMIFNGKLQMTSNPDFVEQIESVLNPIRERELSKAMLEVAAIVAYKQPITRGEIEDLRGVNSDYSIAMLAKHNIVQVVGRKDAIGKPLLFGTTDEFLRRFQLESLDDLPDYDEIVERINVLHTPKSSDLFYKEEYVPEDELLFVENGEPVGEQLSIHTEKLLDENDAAADEDDTLYAVSGEIDTSEPSGADEEQTTEAEEQTSQADTDTDTEGAAKHEPARVMTEDDLINQDPIPDFLKGEDDIEII